MTNIGSLTPYRATLGCGAEADLEFSLTFTLADGVTPVSLAGIGFALTVGSEAVLTSAPGGGVSVGGAGGNVLSVFWPAAAKTAWRGVYPLELVASDGTRTRTIFPGTTSSLTVSWGLPATIRLTAIPSPTATLVTAANPLLVANTLAIAALQAVATPVLVSASQAITEPGTYLVTTPGVTLLLASAATIGGDVFIVDWTGSTSPNIAAIGSIGLGGTSAAITAAGGSLWLRPFPALPAYVLMAMGGGGGGGSSGVTIGTDLDIGSSEL